MEKQRNNPDEKVFMLKMSAELHKSIKRASVDAGITMHDLIVITLENAFLKKIGNTEKKD